MNKSKLSAGTKIVIVTLFILFIINLLQATFTELADDEAYYWLYSKNLAWGYFDHPPFNALIIKAGTLISNGTLGIRLFTAILHSITVFILWFIIRNGKETIKDALIFLSITLTIPIFFIYGFISTSDAPLMFFSSLYLLAYKKFIEKNNLSSAFLMGLSIAGMGYSKYHGILVVLSVLISNTSLLKNYKYYISIIFASILFFPHLLWQYNHDFVSFQYHLIGRNSGFSWHYPFEYLLNIIGLYNPLLTIPFFYILFFKTKFRKLTKIQKALYSTTLIFFIFFLFSGIRGHIQPQWTLPALFGFTSILYEYTLNNKKLSKYILYAGVTSVTIFIIIRFLLIFNIFNLSNFEFYDNKNRYGQLATLAKGKPMVFNTSYQLASKYMFYAGNISHSQSHPNGNRKSQFDLWKYDETMFGKDIMYISPTLINKLDIKGWEPLGYTYIPNFIPTRKILLNQSGLNKNLTPKDTVNFILSIENPYPYNIKLSDSLNIKMLLYSDKKNQTCTIHIPFDYIKANSTLTTDAYVIIPENTGIYKAFLGIYTSPMEKYHNSASFEVTIIK